MELRFQIEFCKQLLVPRLRTFEQLLKKREYFVIGTVMSLLILRVIGNCQHA